MLKQISIEINKINFFKLQNFSIFKGVWGGCPINFFDNCEDYKAGENRTAAISLNNAVLEASKMKSCKFSNLTSKFSNLTSKFSNLTSKLKILIFFDQFSTIEVAAQVKNVTLVDFHFTCHQRNIQIIKYICIPN